MWIQHRPKGSTASKFVAAMVGGVTLLSHAALADTVYRCGETYSTSSQCANGTGSIVKPSSVLHATGQDKDNGSTATRDMRDAQALEKQRLQAERQAAQAAPIRLSTPIAPPPSSATHSEPYAHKGKHQGKHAHQPNSPFFTAVDPTAGPKKKNTAKAVPAQAATSP